MENKKITKVGICVAIALAGGINYFSFSDMGNNIDNHVIEPIKISMEKSRIAEEKAEKEREEKKKADDERKAIILEKQLAKQKEENQKIARLLQEKAEQNKKILEDMNKVKNTPSVPVINYSIPSTSNGNNQTYMTAFGITASAETVKLIDIINPENYLVYKNLQGVPVFAALNINTADHKEYKGLKSEVDDKYSKILISQSGQQYLYEKGCRAVGEDVTWLKIIPDSPSVLSKTNQICSLIPIVDKDNQEAVKKTSVDEPITRKENLSQNVSNNLTKEDIERSLDFGRYKNIVSQSRNYYSFGGKSGNISFNVDKGFVNSATGGYNQNTSSRLNDYYNSIMISSDRKEILVYNKLCPINFGNKNVVVKMSDEDNNEQYFISNERGLISTECAVLPLVKSHGE